MDQHNKPLPKKGKRDIKNHPFFGMHSDKRKSVETQMQELRRERYEHKEKPSTLET